MNDFKFAFRQLLKHPGFTAVAALTLALGIGANTAIFGVINELLLRPLPVREPETLLGIVLTERCLRRPKHPVSNCAGLSRTDWRCA